MADARQKIGDPLAEAAERGILGGRRPIGTREPPSAAPASVDVPKGETPGTPARRRKPKREREKKTILFEPARAQWLEIQAATERREMSDIVADALALYERLYSSEQKGT